MAKRDIPFSSSIEFRRHTHGAKMDYAMTFYRNKSGALNFLQRLSCNKDLMDELRHLLSNEVYELFRQSDAQVVSQVADMLADGRIYVVDVHKELHDPDLQEKRRKAMVFVRPQSESVHDAVAPAPTQKPSAKKAEAKQEAPKDGMDQDMQAAALLAASEEGAPFCEECEKARRESQQAA